MNVDGVLLAAHRTPAFAKGRFVITACECDKDSYPQ